MSTPLSPVSRNELLEHYRSMGRLSGQMLEAARAGDWDRLIELEKIRFHLESEVRRHDTLAWEGQAAVDKAQALRLVQAGGEEIAALAAQRMKELRAPISHANMAVKVNQAYNG